MQRTVFVAGTRYALEDLDEAKRAELRGLVLDDDDVDWSAYADLGGDLDERLTVASAAGDRATANAIRAVLARRR